MTFDLSLDSHESSVFLVFLQLSLNIIIFEYINLKRLFSSLSINFNVYFLKIFEYECLQVQTIIVAR